MKIISNIIISVGAASLLLAGIYLVLSHQVIPAVKRREQTWLFRGVLTELGRSGEPVNHILEVDIKDKQIVSSFYDPPRSPK